MNKYRHEFKYLITTNQMFELKKRLDVLMKIDPNVDKDLGYYNIRSIYFDDYNNRCFLENENGVDPREKFRIRIYNNSDKRISLELKRKERSKTLKTSCLLNILEFNNFVEGKANGFVNKPLMNKLSLEILKSGMRPKVIVSYDRYPYVYKDGNVRITFDTNLSSSVDYKHFFDKNLIKRPVMPKGLHLLEVKYDELLPDVIYKALNTNTLQQIAYSKYYLCRKYNIK